MTDKEDQVEPDAVDSLPITYTSTLPEPQAQLAKDDQVPEGASESVEDKAVSTAEAASSMDASKPTLSKHQQRKIARQERLLATKSERRAREKAAKKERKAEKRRLVEEEGADPYEIGLKKVKKVKTVHKFNANVVIDLGFDDKMSEKNIKSMSTQLAHVYNVNRHAACPVNVIFTPLYGQLKQRMIEGRKADYLRWKGLQVHEQPIQELWKGLGSASTSNEASSQSADRQAALTTDENETHNDHVTVRKEDVIYLTADSKNTLSTLDEGKTYIIGGIVDHNKYPKLCLGIAQEHGIAHAALPIGEYVQMATRKVLTVNQCFEIMSKWLEYRDWDKAFHDVIPKRKFEGAKQRDTSTTPLVSDNSPYEKASGVVEAETSTKLVAAADGM